MRLVLHVWRERAGSPGGFQRYDAEGLNEHMSFLEMLDVVNGRLIEAGQDPIAFEHDCREGICGSCGMVINGEPHGPVSGDSVTQDANPAATAASTALPPSASTRAPTSAVTGCPAAIAPRILGEYA